MAKERILVTGVAGFIGSAIAEKLLDLEYEVFGIDDLSSGINLEFKRYKLH